MVGLAADGPCLYKLGGQDRFDYGKFFIIVIF